jgi:hemerythrin
MTQALIVQQDVQTVVAEALDACQQELRGQKTIEIRQSMNRMIALIPRLRDIADCSRYLEGGIIAKFKEGNYWKQLEGVEDMTFPQFCEEKVGILWNRADYLMRMYIRARDVGLSLDRLREVGWYKGREILRVASRDTLDDWVKQAKGKTETQVKRDVKVEYERQKGNLEPVLMDLLQFQVSEEQKRNIEAAIEEVQVIAKQAGTTLYSKSECLDLLVTEWWANHIREKDRSLRWHMKQLERAYGVQLLVEAAPEGDE